jgi:hypothetical protein
MRPCCGRTRALAIYGAKSPKSRIGANAAPRRTNTVIAAEGAQRPRAGLPCTLVCRAADRYM